MQDILTDLEYKPVLASVGKRWVASFIDFLLVILGFIIIASTVGEYMKVKNGSTIKLVFWFIGTQLCMVLPWLLLLPGMEAINNGQTIGKALFRIKAVRENGSKINFGKSVLRHLFDIIDYFPTFGIIGILVSSYNSKKQRVGDLVAKTIVVDTKK